MTRVLWLHTDRLGCGTYRMYQPAMALQQPHGPLDSTFLLHADMPPPTADELDGLDVVVFQRGVSDMMTSWMRACRERGIQVVFELDDDLFHLASNNPAYGFWTEKKTARALRWTLDFADRVIVSTPPLRQAVQEAMGWPHQNKIRVCYNFIHPEVWGEGVWGGTVPHANTGLVIGWGGSPTHDTDFKEVLPALVRVLETYPNVRVRFLGSIPESVRGVLEPSRFEFVKGVEFDRYPSLLHHVNLDIGLAPITPSKFNIGKSNIKWLEYSAVRVPCIASRVYPYERSIDDGRTGFLAGKADEWFTKLAALIEDAGQRRAMASAAHVEVWSQWSHVTRAPAWVTALERQPGIPWRVVPQERYGSQSHAQLARPS